MRYLHKAAMALRSPRPIGLDFAAKPYAVSCVAPISTGVGSSPSFDDFRCM